MRKILVLTFLAASLGACATARDTRMASGAAVGGVAGAVVAGPLGLVVGGGVGAALADTTRPRSGVRCHYSHTLERRVCHYR